MNIFERIRGVIFGEQKQTTTINVSTTPTNSGKDDDIGEVIAPAFKEIPPETNLAKYIQEGLRSWLYIATSAIADEISTTEINLFKRVGNSKDWVEIEEHQVLNIIEKPNNFQTKEEFLWLVSIFLLVEGEAPILMDSDKNPNNLVMLNPERLKIVYDAVKTIGYYVYTQTNGKIITIQPERVLFLKLPSTQTPFRGCGGARYIAQTLDIDFFIEEYLKVFFYNDATPGAVLETDAKLTDKTIDRLRVLFNQKFKGIKNKHKMIILEQGLHWKEITAKLSELQMPNIEAGIRDKILAAYKVPKSVIGVIDDVNRANGENSDRVFARRAVKPKLKMVQSQLNQFFLPRFSEGANLWFEFENPVQEDELIKAQVREINIRSGVRTVNEYRTEDGLQPIEVVKDEEEMPEEKTTEEKPKDDEEPKKMINQKFKHINKARFMLKKVEKIEKEKKDEKVNDALISVMKDFLRVGRNNKEFKRKFSDEEKEKFHKDKIMFTDKIEGEFREKLAKNFKRVRKMILGNITDASKSMKKKDLSDDMRLIMGWNDDEEIGIMKKLSKPYLQIAFIKESDLAYSLLGFSEETFRPQDRVVREFLAERTLKLGESTTETTRNDIERIVNGWGKEEDASWVDLKNNINEYFDNAESKRSEMIARTEISNATGTAQEEVYKDVGAIEKQWITASDERVCIECAELDGKTVAIDGKFEENDFGDVGSQPLHPNCRCDILPIFAEERSYNKNKKK